MTTEVETTPEIEALIERYIQLRDRKTKMKADYDASVANIDTAMTRVEGYLQTMMNNLGLESLRTGAGTAYQTVRTSCSTADWDSYLAWVRSNEYWSAIERRVSKSFVEEYRDKYNDLPPGVNWTESRAVNVKRS